MEPPLFEDNHLLVLWKPSGWTTQPSPSGGNNLEEKAKQWIKERDQKKGGVFLHALHRLDRPVCGIVIFCKTQKGLSRLQQSLREGKIKKTYQARLSKPLSSATGVLEHTLFHDDHFARVVHAHHPQGKQAILSYKVLETSPTPLVEIDLKTGRYHQIRAQFAAIGAPIIGDKLYGSPIPYKPDAIALQHIRCCCPHPISGLEIHLESNLRL